MIYHPAIVALEKTLSKYYTERLPNISELAKECNMSNSTFKRYFKLAFKESIYAYYLRKKMELGKEMLSDTDLTVSEIAYHLGYDKINSFSKVFKKYYGCLPRDYKNIHVQKQPPGLNLDLGDKVMLCALLANA